MILTHVSNRDHVRNFQQLPHRKKAKISITSVYNSVPKSRKKPKWSRLTIQFQFSFQTSHLIRSRSWTSIFFLEFLGNFCLKLLYSVHKCLVWQYGLWRFQTGGTKLERVLPKNQHTQRKLLNFENWVNGGLRSFKSQLFSSS